MRNIILKKTEVETMGKILAIVNHKGGVGKTTTAINVAAALSAFHNKKVLLIDLDGQANLTTHCGIFEEPQHSMFEVLYSSLPIKQAIVHMPMYDIVPAKLDLSGVEISLVNKPAREMVLKKAIQSVVGNYDIIIIDCPPTLGLLTFNALTASDYFIITLQTEFFALHGLSRILTEVVEIVKENLNENLFFAGIVATMFDKRRALHIDALEKAKESYAHDMFNSVIRINSALSDASAEGKNIFEYEPKSRGALDYKNMAKELLKRLKL